jgi:anthranilate/para-aminobenzoate synthase component II
MSQLDDIVKINNADQWVYSVTDQAETWKTSLTSIKNENVHVMNKRALDRNFNDIIAALDNTV